MTKINLFQRLRLCKFIGSLLIETHIKEKHGKKHGYLYFFEDTTIIELLTNCKDVRELLFGF
jgi:hypothetical protein